MPHVTFDSIFPGVTYSRHELAALWGYRSFHALARGVVTPAGDDKIILFVTENKKADRVPYRDQLVGQLLHWEGPTDHFAEDRMRPSGGRPPEIHIFYRRHAYEDFEYMGLAEVVEYTCFTNQPSLFTFRVRPG